jgi:hypothetical protein
MCYSFSDICPVVLASPLNEEHDEKAGKRGREGQAQLSWQGAAYAMLVTITATTIVYIIMGVILIWLIYEVIKSTFF